MLKLLQIPHWNQSSHKARHRSKDQRMNGKLPRYLQQSRQELLRKFKEIKLLEGDRIHDVNVLKDQSYWSFSHGLEAFDLKRNRYMNILPWDRTRVKLDVLPGYNDFINASHVTLDLRKDGIQSSREEYISSQGPTRHTVDHFWHMVLQQSPAKNVVICMVTPLQEFHVTKCFKYWCDQKGDVVYINGSQDGFKYDLELTCLDSINTVDVPGVTYTTISLKALENDRVVEEKTVHHLYFDQWTDCSKPDDWKAIYKLNKMARELNDPENKLIVHCSAGVGRTGTFIALDYLFNSVDLRAADNREDLDPVEALVQSMRTQRMMMVQSQEQFLFIYDSLRSYLVGG